MTEDRKITDYKGNEITVTKEHKWQLLADCIRSGQVDSRELHEEFEKDPEFKKWYMKKYLMD